MLTNLLVAYFSLVFFTHQGTAQTSTISVGPLLTCGLTTFSCPGVSGCCTIAGCCGSGCCAVGYSCINEGTADEACCPASDPTKCGTVTPTSNDDDGTTTGNGQCTGIQNCPRDPVADLAWTCLLGQTCGLSYRECNPCVPTSSGGDSNTDNGSDSNSDPNSSTSDSDPSSSTSNSASSTSPDSGGSSPTSPGHRSEHVNLWMAIMLVSMLAVLL